MTDCGEDVKPVLAKTLSLAAAQAANLTFYLYYESMNPSLSSCKGKPFSFISTHTHNSRDIESILK